MQIRIFGYAINKKKLPPAVQPAEIYAALIANKGAPIDRKELIRAACTTVDATLDGKKSQWYAGMLVKARDAKAFNELKKQDGKLMLTSKQLENGKIAEVAYFLGHLETGHGLVAVYHGGPGTSILRYVFGRTYGILVRGRRRQGLKDAKGDPDAREKVIQQFTGELDIENLARKQDLKQLLKDLKKVSTVKLKFRTVQTSSGFFKKLAAHAVSETETFHFPPDFVIDDALADEFEKGVDDESVIEASAEGEDSTGHARKVSSELARNLLVFGEIDYDQLLGDLQLDLSDWDPTIQKSPVIEWLRKHLSHAATRALLAT